MDFLIIAHDGNDAHALERRLKARRAHLANTEKYRRNGNFIAGGALLDDNEEMIGSTLYMRFESKQELQEWLDNDPYTTGDVWQEVEIKTIRLVQFD